MPETTEAVLEPDTAAEPYRWVEAACTIHVYETTHGQCVAYARKRVADKRWEVKLAGPGHLVHEVEHRGKARGKLRRLVAGIGGGS